VLTEPFPRSIRVSELLLRRNHEKLFYDEDERQSFLSRRQDLKYRELGQHMKCLQEFGAFNWGLGYLTDHYEDDFRGPFDHDEEEEMPDDLESDPEDEFPQAVIHKRDKIALRSFLRAANIRNDEYYYADTESTPVNRLHDRLRQVKLTSYPGFH